MASQKKITKSVGKFAKASRAKNYVAASESASVEPLAAQSGNPLTPAVNPNVANDPVADVSRIPDGGSVGHDEFLRALATPETRDRLEEKMRAATGGPRDMRVAAHEAAIHATASAMVASAFGPRAK